LDYSTAPVPGRAEPVWFGVSLTGWLKVLIVGGLMVWLFYIPCLRRLWQKTNPIWGEPNWGHAILVPFAGLYYLYLNRDELVRAKVKPLLGAGLSRARFIGGAAVLVASVLLYLAMPFIVPSGIVEYARGGMSGFAILGGLAILLDWGLGSRLWGLLVFGYGIYPGQNDWIKDFGMVATLFGVVLTLCGWGVMKTAWFPILFLICALPWPGLVYSKIASPLQQLAATVAVFVLDITGVEAFRSGTKIFMGNGITSPMRALNVAEACAGMKALMTFISLGAAMAFLSQRPLWQKLVICVSAVPIAIFCNVMRVAGQGLLDHYASPKWSESFAHQFVGMVLLVPAIFLLMLVGWLLDQIFIEEVDKPRSAGPQSDGRAPRAPVTGPRRPELHATKTEAQ
jgi:exosortase